MGIDNYLINENDNIIRIFISSTFRDMTEERKAIQKKIYPELKEYGYKKGIYIDVCDLRWGLAQEIDGSDGYLVKTMASCFREIKACKPYLVTMIGNYYGYEPNDLILSKIIETNEFLHGIDKDKPVSLTHLELISAGLVNNDSVPEFNFFCFFKTGYDENDKTKQLVEDIKTRQKKYGKYVYTKEYNDLNDFVDHLTEEGKKLIDKKAEILEKTNIIELEFRHAEAYATERSRLFAGRIEELEEIKEKLKNNTVVRIYGRSGIGKTTIMSKIFYDINYKKENKIFIAGGVGDESGQYINVLRQIIYFLEKKINGGVNPEIRNDLIKEEDGEKEIKKLLTEYDLSKNDEIIIFIDAVDKIEKIDDLKIINIFSEQKGKKVKCLYSEKLATESREHNRDERDKNEIKIDKLSPEDMAVVVSRKIYPSEDDYKEISNEVSQRLEEKKESVLPLYIDSAAYLLKTSLDSFKGVIDNPTGLFVDEIKKMPDTLQGICLYTFNKSGKEFASDIWEKIIGLIAFSNKGLRTYDMSMIIGESWREVDFTLFRQNLSFYFKMNPGFFWTFEHDLIKDSIRKNMHIKKKEYYRLITDYLINDESDKEILYREGWRLCVENMDYEAIDRLEDKLLQRTIDLDISSNELIHVVKELHDVMDDTDEIIFDRWFERLTLTDRFGTRAIKFLEKILREEEESKDSYNRRYPALMITDRFWKIFKERYSSLEDWDRNDDKTTVTFKLYKSFLCVGYISACESLGRGIDALYYTDYPVKILTEFQKKYIVHDGTKDYNLLKTSAIRALNSILYCNNQTMNKVIDYSKTIVGTYNRYSEPATVYPDDIAYLYESNIGQYHNGIKNYDEALKWHKKSMLHRIDVMRDELVEVCENVSAIDKFREIIKNLLENKIITASVYERDDDMKCGIDPKDYLNVITESYMNVNEEYEKSLEEIITLIDDIIKKTKSGKEKQDKYKNLLRRLAVGCRTIGTDVYHIVHNMKRNDPLLCRLICVPAFMMALSKFIFEKNIIRSDYKREVMTTQLRWIGNVFLIREKGFNIEVKEIINELTITFMDSSDEYIDNIKMYIETKGFYLDFGKFYKKLTEIAGDHTKEILKKQYEKIKTRYEELKSQYEK